MTAGNDIVVGISAASMTATWIWASSMYASATSGYTYGISGPIHYGLWGALMILFIYPFGQRIRKVAPKAHTLAEVIDRKSTRLNYSHSCAARMPYYPSKKNQYIVTH